MRSLKKMFLYSSLAGCALLYATSCKTESKKSNPRNPCPSPYNTGYNTGSNYYTNPTTYTTSTTTTSTYTTDTLWLAGDENEFDDSMQLASQTVQMYLQTNCNSCHSTTGSKRDMPFDTSSNAQTRGASIVASVVKQPGTLGFMPKGRTVANEQADISMLQAWQAAGFPDWAFAAPVTNGVNTDSYYNTNTNPYTTTYTQPCY